MVLGGDTIDNIPLDEEGKYTYTFQAEEANVEPPYTQAISVSLILGDKVTPWYWNYSEEGQSLRGAVFSAKLTGSSFVTKAPDQLLNILRDPFGSNSTVTWATGSTHSVSFSRDISYDYSFGGAAEVKGGAGMTTAVGAVGAYTTKLRKGSSGTQVKKLQQALIKLGYLPAGEDDGKYGNKTAYAVMQFQWDHGIGVDGVAGSKTFVRLNEALDALP